MLYTPASKSSNTTPNEFLIFLSTQYYKKLFQNLNKFALLFLLFYELLNDFCELAIGFLEWENLIA